MAAIHGGLATQQRSRVIDFRCGALTGRQRRTFAVEGENAAQVLLDERSCDEVLVQKKATKSACVFSARARRRSAPSYSPPYVNEEIYVSRRFSRAWPARPRTRAR